MTNSALIDKLGDVVRWTLAASVTLLAGCGGSDFPKLVDYLEEIEFDVPLETATYVSLGKFDIPIAASKESTDAAPEHAADEAIWMRLRFELSAETTPGSKKAATALAADHRGVLSDAVISVIRTSSVDELADPRMSAVKTRLTEIVRPILGEERVRQLVLNELDADEMENDAPAEEEEEHGHH